MIKFLRKIKKKFLYKLQAQLIPEIIGYPIWNNKKTEGLRISNTTHVSNKSNVIFNKNTFVGHFNYLDGHTKINIGEGVQITNYVSIATHSSHNSIRVLGSNYEEHFRYSPSLLKGEVNIGDYTYIGPHSVVMPGVNIGKGCVVSAYSYVSHDVADYSVVRGVPAKVVGNTRDLDQDYLKEHPNEKGFHFDNIF